MTRPLFVSSVGLTRVTTTAARLLAAGKRFLSNVVRNIIPMSLPTNETGSFRAHPSSRTSHGWAEIDRERKRELIDAIRSGTATRGPVHAELDLTDRCNVDCYFCNQQDVRSKEQIALPHAIALVDELAEAGLRSVRLSGGGDPLFHRQILEILDHLQRRSVVVDNVTTNGVGLTAEVARRLVAANAREVIVSLNAVDADDYHRMMQVKPALFETVVAHVRQLIEIRADAGAPSVTVQFLLDRRNCTRLEEMYELGRSTGADRIAVGLVLHIPHERIDAEVLLVAEDAGLMEPHLRRVLEMDRDAGLLQIDFPIGRFNEMAAHIRHEVGAPAANLFPVAGSFQEKNGGCFFAWYTMTINGSGNIYPCCLLMNPDYEPLGNIHEKPALEHWRGDAFQTMREEMRDVLLVEGRIRHSRERFRHLDPNCIEQRLCWLKNMYFRADEEFYRELGEALESMRRTDLGWFRGKRAARLRLEQLIHDHPQVTVWWKWLTDVTRPVRRFLRNITGIRALTPNS
ncbi:MAG TPA: radical SAM protein [Thermoanaerobaculia bacterium]|nr:radical SAM protein [Thermoanaerobaculia bacterium]